jgi:hypothetical protein
MMAAISTMARQLSACYSQRVGKRQNRFIGMNFSAP